MDVKVTTVVDSDVVAGFVVVDVQVVVTELESTPVIVVLLVVSG